MQWLDCVLKLLIRNKIWLNLLQSTKFRKKHVHDVKIHIYSIQLGTDLVLKIKLSVWIITNWNWVFKKIHRYKCKRKFCCIRLAKLIIFWFIFKQYNINFMKTWCNSVVWFFCKLEIFWYYLSWNTLNMNGLAMTWFVDSGVIFRLSCHLIQLSTGEAVCWFSCPLRTL